MSWAAWKARGKKEEGLQEALFCWQLEKADSGFLLINGITDLSSSSTTFQVFFRPHSLKNSKWEVVEHEKGEEDDTVQKFKTSSTI